MPLINYLNRPEYIFRPIQIYRRLSRSLNSKRNSCDTILLPWGVRINISSRSRDVVECSLLKMGIYDLVITEVIWRLIDRGETAIDIGAHIGYMTTIMAKRVGKLGRVLCFEANPDVYRELLENIKNCQKTLNSYRIFPHKIALSNQSGWGLLRVPIRNRGEACLISFRETNTEDNKNNLNQSYTIPLKRLDDLLNNNDQIGVMKVDVEGHELEVLQGAVGLNNKYYIRDILYEDHKGYPTSVSQFLEEHGYTIFRIWKGFWKPLLEQPSKTLIHPWEPPSYLATQEPLRTIERLKKRGWSSLQGTTETGELKGAS